MAFPVSWCTDFARTFIASYNIKGILTLSAKKITTLPAPNSKKPNASLNIKVVQLWQYRGADKSLARPGRKQARKNVRDARDFNNIETREVIKFVFLQGKAPKKFHTILTETLACFFSGRAKNLSASL